MFCPVYPPAALAIIESVLQGREPNGISLAKRTKTLPEDWAEQHQLFEFSNG